MSETTTIAALATAAGTAGISITRISGPLALAIAAAVFRPAGAKAAGAPAGGFQSYRMYYGHVIDPATGNLLDEVLLAVMRSPRSYTREDVIEIHAHGGSAASRAILNTVLAQGARLAEPGEFTRRAFLSGRIDLTQAEAVIDLIQAHSILSLQSAAALISGGLKLEVEQIKFAAVELLAEFNASIDFPDDVEDTRTAAEMQRLIRTRFIMPFRQLIQNYAEGRILREGLALAIVGRPNVGKSSLMNRLLNRDRAIVTPLPGTTRDIVEDSFILKGIPVTVADTAGIHPSLDPVEIVGMRKAIEAAQGADLVLFVTEAHRPLDEQDRALFEQVRHKPMILVRNKADLMPPSVAAPQIPHDWQTQGRFVVSALSGQGIEELREYLCDASGGEGRLAASGTVVPNLRQKAIIEQGLNAAASALEEIERGRSVEIIAFHLSDILRSCNEILGVSSRPDLLDEIFSRFCIGK